MDGMLSQEEINALLNGGGAATEDTSTVEEGQLLSDAEKDAIGEISNISMGTAATTLSSLVNSKVVITTPTVSYCTWDELAKGFDRPCVFVQISYREGVEGNNNLILREDDVKVITDLMMGGDGKGVIDELSVLHLSAISEAMNQMMGSASTSLSSMLNRKIDINPPVANLVDLNGTLEENSVSELQEGTFVCVSFKMQIGDLVDSELRQLYTVEFAKSLYAMFNSMNEKAEKNDSVTENVPTQPQEVQPQMVQPQINQPQMNQQQMVQPQMNQQQMVQQPYMGQPQYMQGQMPGYGMPTAQDINVSPVQFQSFNQAPNPITQQENINLIMDVPLEVTVELGRTSKSIKEILEFAPGTIIELDKIAGEPVDVIVNGKQVAKGEVVVIEESFGVRVTEIIK